jgi:hypothetical protein
MSTRAHHWFLFWAWWIQPMACHCTSVGSFVILPSIFTCVFKVVSSYQVFWLKFCIISHMCYMLCHLILPKLITWIIFGEEYRSWSLSLCCFLQPPVNFLSLRFRYSSQHTVLRHPHLCCFWRWRQQGPPKRWYPTTSLHSITVEKTMTLIFINGKTLNLITYWWFIQAT